MPKVAIAFAALVLVALPRVGAALNVPPPPQAGPVIVIGATVHTVSGDVHAPGFLAFENGRIAGVGPAADAPAPDERTTVIELDGDRHVYPGLISSHTVLGLVEINAVRATVDVTEPGVLNANARAEVAVNPDSELIPVTRANGVLTALVVPRAGSGGMVAGRSALMRLDGWTWEAMTVAAPVGVHAFWPTLRRSPWAAEPADPEEPARLFAEAVEGLERTLEAARAHSDAREADPGTPLDLRLEALAPVAAGEQPLYVHADDLHQIESALNLAERQGLRLVIVGGYDAWRVADRLRSLDVAVIVSPVLRLPMRRWEAYDEPFRLPARLAEAGVPFAIARAGDGFSTAHERNLPYEAAMAAAHGLSPDEALKAVTLYPARILGVGDRLGSLETGKEATFIVTDGSPLEITTNVERAFVTGREIDLSSRHTRLYEKYREKYRQLALPAAGAE